LGRIANFIEPVIDLATRTFRGDCEFHANYNPMKFSSVLIDAVIDLATLTFRGDCEFHASYNPVKFSSVLIDAVIDLATLTFRGDCEFHANYTPVKFSSLGRIGTSKLELPFAELLMDDVLQIGSKFTLSFHRLEMSGAPLRDAVGLLAD
jgi:hypothetical protein